MSVKSEHEGSHTHSPQTEKLLRAHPRPPRASSGRRKHENSHRKHDNAARTPLDPPLLRAAKAVRVDDCRMATPPPCRAPPALLRHAQRLAVAVRERVRGAVRQQGGRAHHGARWMASTVQPGAQGQPHPAPLPARRLTHARPPGSCPRSAGGSVCERGDWEARLVNTRLAQAALCPREPGTA